MGQMVSFPSNGSACSAYEAVPARTGPGVIVIQEWWGLVDHIKDVCDRFASEGFVAVAPDLYHGHATKEPDEAGKLLMSLNIEQAGRDMSGAYEYLMQNPVVEPKKVGIVGFCMGGNLALQLAAIKPLSAAAPFYPYPFVPFPDPAQIRGAVHIHVGEHDQGPSPDKAQEYVTALRAQGREAETFVYPGCDHAFFNDERPDAYNPGAAKTAWERTISLFREHLE